MCRKYFEILTRTNAALTASFFLPEIGGRVAQPPPVPHP